MTKFQRNSLCNIKFVCLTKYCKILKTFLNKFGKRKFLSHLTSKTLWDVIENGVCWLEWDRPDIKMNKLTAVTLEVSPPVSKAQITYSAFSQNK